MSFLDKNQVRLIEETEEKYAQLNCDSLEADKAQCVSVKEEMKRLADAMEIVRKQFHSCKDLELQDSLVTEERNEQMRKCAQNFRSAFNTTVNETYERLRALGISHN